MPGCIEHTTMIWEAIQNAKRNQLSLHVVWLDLANAYGSVPHQLLWKTLATHHVPRVVIEVLQEYFNGFVMRFSTKECTTGWIPLQVGIVMGCAISPSLFVLAMEIVLNAVRAGIPEARMGRGVHMPSIKAFMDDTTIVLRSRKQIVQRDLDELNDLLLWCRMARKPAKYRSLSLTRGKVRSDVYFTVGGQRIPTVSEEPVKSLGRVFDELLRDKNQEAATVNKMASGLNAIARAPLQCRFKVWLLQFVLLPRLLWPLTIYEMGLPSVEEMERKINQYTRKWLGLPPSISSIALYTRSARLRLPLRSIVEEYKISKIRTQWSLNNSKDNRVREVMPQLRSGRKFREQEEIEKSQAILAFEEIRGPIQVDRHGVGWSHFERWSTADAPAKAAKIIQERRRQMETDRIALAVQQSQQGQWTTWDEVLQRSVTWKDIWRMSPLRLAFMIRSVYDVLPSRTNLQKWGIVQEAGCSLCGCSQSLRHVLSSCSYALAHGRYTWRHNQVLQVVLEAARTACSQANARETAPARRIYFLREGSAQHRKEKNEKQRRDLLSKAKDWEVSADLQGERHCHKVLQESGKQPDLVLASTATDSFILIELTVPWEDRMDLSNALKSDRYLDLTMDLEARGYGVHLFAIEVGARGLVGKSTYAFLRAIGFSNRQTKHFVKELSEVAESASHWIWTTKDRK